MEDIPFSKETEDIILGNIMNYEDEYDNVEPFLRGGEVFYQSLSKLL